MGTWDTGFLHQRCLEARIGRRLTRDDLLVWYIRGNFERSEFGRHPDYLSSPEFRKGGGYGQLPEPNE